MLFDNKIQKFKDTKQLLQEQLDFLLEIGILIKNKIERSNRSSKWEKLVSFYR